MIEEQVPRILSSLPTRISDITLTWAERTPEKIALKETSGSWTYRELTAVVAETQTWLRSLGVRPRDRVVLVCENCRAFVAILFALTALDAWPVLVNARLTAREIDQIREHCGARRVIYTVAASPHAAAHAKHDGAVIQDFAGVGAIGVGSLNDSVEPDAAEQGAADPVAAMIYTSGTTGMPKGVMLTHKGLLFIATISARLRSLSPEDRVLGILPMSHAVGLSVVLLGSLLSGATLYLWSRFDPVAARAALDKERLTVVLGTPAMFALLVESAKLRGLKSLHFPHLRIISSSGAPLDLATKTGVENLFGMSLHNGYGVTECSPTIAQMRVDEPRKDTSVGRIFPGVEVQLIGVDGHPVGPGSDGELRVRGPNLMKGYYRAEEETRQAIDSEGWFNTRDLARLVEDNLFIVGRTKDLIVRFGFNVYPAEIELVLNLHPAIVRSAVVGQAVEGNEEVIAFVQLKPEFTATAAEISEFSAKHLAPYKRPSKIVFVAAMPITLTGKIQKDELVRLLAADSPASQ
jgi:long-chain acyl-CoA synthetase